MEKKRQMDYSCGAKKEEEIEKMKKKGEVGGKEYVFVRILIPKGHSEAVNDLIWQSEPLGIETEIEDENVEIIRVYFNKTEETDNLKKKLNKSGLECAILDDGKVKYEDWESFLHGGFEPLACGNIYVVPAENPPPIPEGKKALYIIPGRGFGTGSHSTTKLCLQAMVNHLSPGARCLDVGAGSGILSIAAMHMGAETIDGVEIDPDSVINADENIELNGFTGDINIKIGSIEHFSGNRYPLILINIIAKVILDLFDEGLLNYLEEDGTIIASGILDEESEKFQKRMEHFGLKVIEKSQDKEWVGFVLTRGK